MLKIRPLLLGLLEDIVKSALFSVGDSRGPPNHHMGPMSERRHEQSSGPEHGADRGPYRGGQDCRGPPDRRGPHPDFPDDFSRPDDFPLIQSTVKRFLFIPVKNFPNSLLYSLDT